MTSFYAGKKVLVTGGTGLIGRPLVQSLLEAGADVKVVALDDASQAHPDAEFVRADLTRFEACLEACRGREIVFHLVGVKGSPAMTAKNPASFFVPMLLFNTSMMEAARQADVERYLFTSSVGVYSPAEVFHEDDVWKTFPSPNDRFAGWAKRMGELQAEAYAIEHDWRTISIVRPANVYGPYDNFDLRTAMVIPSLIRRAVDGERPLNVWGDGSQVRDFIHANDVAYGMLLAVEKGISEPMNLGSGVGVSVKQIVEIITDRMNPAPEVTWDTTKPVGDRIRLLDIARARSHGWAPKISISDGIASTMEWYAAHRDEVHKRFNVFTESKLA